MKLHPVLTKPHPSTRATMFSRLRVFNGRTCSPLVFSRFSGSSNGGEYPRELLSVPVSPPLPPSFQKDGSPLVFKEGMQGETEITQLSNGLRVASQSSFGQYSTIGVFIDAGSRYEVDYKSGVSQFLSKMAYQSTSRFSSRDSLLLELEQYGGLPDFQCFRDIMFYSVSVFSYSIPLVMSILSDVIWRPQLLERELEESRQAILFEWEDHQNRPQPEALLMDLVHQAAYRNNTLGLPSISNSNRANEMTLSELKRFIASHYIPSRMVLVGVNVDHTQLVELAEEHFVNPKTNWSDVTTSEVDGSISQYTGGIIEVPRESAPIIGPNPLPELTHVAVAMESSSYSKNDFYTFAVLNSLMGGGGSFSAGGPGKGMYTQLYLNVLNKHHWTYHAQAMNHAYSDTGIFCLFGSSHPSMSRKLVEVLCQQFYNMTQSPNPIAVARAKKQLQSTLLMNLESRLINFEDIGRQVLAHSKRLSAKQICDKIDAVTSDDIVRVSKEMYNKSQPAVAYLGDLSNVPKLKEVESALRTDNGSFLNRVFSFR